MDFAIEPGGKEHVPAVCQIMRECVLALPRKEFFIDDSAEIVEERLRQGVSGHNPN